MLPLIHPKPDDATVPCNGCNACCHHALILMLPEHGDRAELYDTQPMLDPRTMTMGLALKQKPDGTCAHLGPKGCEIYDIRPAICRTYDCRRHLLNFGDRHAQRRAVREGMLSKDVYRAGRERLPTLA